MLHLNDASNQDFEQIIASKDINKIKTFANKGEKLYKNVLEAIEKDLEQYIYEQSNQVALKFSPDTQTAAFLVSEKACPSKKDSPQYNLSLQVLRADINGCFHKTEKFAYAFYEEISFERLEDDSLIMKNGLKPHLSVVKTLKQLPAELRTPLAPTASENISAAEKILLLQNLKKQYRCCSHNK